VCVSDARRGGVNQWQIASAPKPWADVDDHGSLCGASHAPASRRARVDCCFSRQRAVGPECAHHPDPYDSLLGFRMVTRGRALFQSDNLEPRRQQRRARGHQRRSIASRRSARAPGLCGVGRSRRVGCSSKVATEPQFFAAHRANTT